MSWMSEKIRVSAALLATLCLASAMLLVPIRASAVAPTGTGDTITCEPGQTANTDLGICQDPLCGPGTQRDPSGQTRYCVPISCPPGMSVDSTTHQCLSTPPPPPVCPGGGVGHYETLSTGVRIVVCPKPVQPPPYTPPHVTTQVPNATLSH